MKHQFGRYRRINGSKAKKQHGVRISRFQLHRSQTLMRFFESYESVTCSLWHFGKKATKSEMERIEKDWKCLKPALLAL